MSYYYYYRFTEWSKNIGGGDVATPYTHPLNPSMLVEYESDMISCLMDNEVFLLKAVIEYCKQLLKTNIENNY